MNKLNEYEQTIINEALSQGRVTDCPQGEVSDDTYIWDESLQKLVIKEKKKRKWHGTRTKYNKYRERNKITALLEAARAAGKTLDQIEQELGFSVSFTQELLGE